MNRYDWKSNIRYNIFSLSVLGLWPGGEETYQFGLYLIYGLTLYSIFVIAHISVQVVNIYFMRDNLEAIVGTSYILMMLILGMMKAFYLMKNMKLLKELLKTLNSDLFQPHGETQRISVESDVRFWKLINKSYVIFAVATNAFMAIFPLVDTSSEERRLPFLAWYPFDSKASPFYEITYIHQVICVGFNTTVHVNVDTLTAVFSMYAGCQFEILSDNLRNLVDKNLNLSENVSERLLRCIRHHKIILGFVEICNRIFNWVIFLEFFISSITIGITMFQLTLVTPLSNEFNSLFCFVIAVTLQIFHYCWFGNEVLLKSGDVPYAIFESDWLDLSKEIKKHLIFFTLHLTKPVRLSALDLFYLTLETFMRIMKTSWSYFALLHQLSDRRKNQ